MKKAFDKLNIYYKCSVLSGLLILLVFFGFVALYFADLGDVPNGLLLGGMLGSLSYLFIGIMENKNNDEYKWVIVIYILRLIIFAALLVLIALCYYKWDLKIFNVFSYTGGYLVSTIIVILIYLDSRERETNERS